jgi:hypothetical protein
MEYLALILGIVSIMFRIISNRKRLYMKDDPAYQKGPVSKPRCFLCFYYSRDIGNWKEYHRFFY